MSAFIMGFFFVLFELVNYLWFGLNDLSSVAHWAHLGGLFFGIFYPPTLFLFRQRRRPSAGKMRTYRELTSSMDSVSRSKLAVGAPGPLSESTPRFRSGGSRAKSVRDAVRDMFRPECCKWPTFRARRAARSWSWPCATWCTTGR